MPQSIVDLAFPYPVRFIRSGHRKAETVYIRGVLPVAFEAASSSEAPIACVIDPNPSQKDHELYLQEVRRHGGRFYLPLSTDEGIPSVDLRLLESAAGKAGVDWEDSPFHAIGKQACDIPLREPVRALPEANDIAVREVIHSWREEVVKKIQAEAINYLLIDGILHRSCPEPRLLVDYRSHGLDFEVLFHNDYPRSRWVNAVFGMHEQEKVTEYVRRLIESGNVHEDYVQEGPLIERVDRSVPWSDFAPDSLSMCAPQIMERARKAAAWLPRPGIEAFIDMRDAYQAFIGGRRGREMITRFCTAYAAIVSHCADDEMSRDDDDPDTARGHNEAHELAQAAERYLIRFRIDGLAPEPPLPEEIATVLAGLNA
ncbi:MULTISPECIES: hypothetical protein [unclassified Bradyrhizobium]